MYFCIIPAFFWQEWGENNALIHCWIKCDEFVAVLESQVENVLYRENVHLRKCNIYQFLPEYIHSRTYWNIFSYK